MLGFALSVYLHIPVTGIAIFGTILAIIITQLQQSKHQVVLEEGDDEDDF